MPGVAGSLLLDLERLDLEELIPSLRGEFTPAPRGELTPAARGDVTPTPRGELTPSPRGEEGETGEGMEVGRWWRSAQSST